MIIKLVAGRVGHANDIISACLGSIISCWNYNVIEISGE